MYLVSVCLAGNRNPVALFQSYDVRTISASFTIPAQYSAINAFVWRTQTESKASITVKSRNLLEIRQTAKASMLNHFATHRSTFTDTLLTGGLFSLHLQTLHTRYTLH